MSAAEKLKPETKERPILFSGPMVRAILEGRKTQTRRVVKGAPYYAREWGFSAFTPPGHISARGVIEQGPCERYVRNPYGVPGDRLWVRETWALNNCGSRVQVNQETWGKDWPPLSRVRYPATDEPPHRTGNDGDTAYWWNKRPSIHMPRWASRITLEITEVRVQRLQDISVDDIFAEIGETRASAARNHCESWEPYDAWADLWDSINGERPGCSWKNNPWVWALTFKRLEGAR